MRRILIAALLAGAVAACQRTEPVYTVENHPIASARALTADQVKEAIAAAGAARQWVFNEVSPGLLRGTHTTGKHTAVVDVLYSETAYAIRLNSSTNLLEGHGMIHRRANGWIRNLEREIDAQLARTALTGG
jgi:hypothetical protein